MIFITYDLHVYEMLFMLRNLYMHRHTGMMLSRGAAESLWRIVMKLPEFNLFSDKSA